MSEPQQVIKKRISELIALCREPEINFPEHQALLQQLEDIRKKVNNLSVLEQLNLSPISWRQLEALLRHQQKKWQDLSQELEEKKQSIEEMRARFSDLAENLRRAREIISNLQRPAHFFVAFERLEKKGTVEKSEWWIRFRQGQHYSSAVIDIDNPKLVEKFKKAKIGQRVRLNGTGVAVELLDEWDDQSGTVVKILQVISANQLRVANEAGAEVVVLFDEHFREQLAGQSLKPGDKVLLSAHGFVSAKVSDAVNIQHLLLQKEPNVTWQQIGGLDQTIERLRDELEGNLLHPESAKRFEVPSPKGILLTGPPGNGKTLLAKAAVNEVAHFLSERIGKKVEGHYILIKGPADIYDKFVGNSEGNVAAVFDAARQKAAEGHLVFVIFDEAEQIFPLRRSEVCDAGTSGKVVAQFNSEMDGVEELSGVVVFALSNRPDLIDPAIIRPGRFELKITVPMPNAVAAKEILAKHLKVSLPFHHQYFDPANYDEAGNYCPRDQHGNFRTKTDGSKISYFLNRDSRRIVDYLIEKLVRRCYDEQRSQNHLRRIVYADGSSETLGFKDFMSGARLANIALDARKKAKKRFDLATDEERVKEGLYLRDLYEALDENFKSEVGIPSTPETLQQWLAVQGRESRPIKSVVLLSEDDLSSSSGKSAKRRMT